MPSSGDFPLCARSGKAHGLRTSAAVADRELTCTTALRSRRERDADRTRLPSTPRLEPQVLLSEKSPAFVPVIPILVMLGGPEPALVTVTAFGELLWPTFTPPKLRLAGESFTAVPVPIDETFCGLPGARAKRSGHQQCSMAESGKRWSPIIRACGESHEAG